MPVREEIVTRHCGTKAKYWSKSDWNDWHKEHTAGAIHYHSPYRSQHLIAESKPRSLTESVPWWLTSCNMLACAKHPLFYWEPVRKIMPCWNRSAVRKRLPTPALMLPWNVRACWFVKTCLHYAYNRSQWKLTPNGVFKPFTCFLLPNDKSFLYFVRTNISNQRNYIHLICALPFSVAQKTWGQNLSLLSRCPTSTKKSAFSRKF